MKDKDKTKEQLIKELDVLRHRIDALEIQKERLATNLQKSVTSFKAVLESITDGFFILDKDWRFTYLNPEAERIWGVKREELTGRVIWEQFPQIVGTTFDKEYRSAAAHRTAVYFKTFSPLIHKWVEVHAYPFQEGLSVYFRDISERKKAEETIRLTEEKFCKAFNASPTLMFIIDFKNRQYIDINDSLLHYIEYRRNEVIGHTTIELNLFANPDDGAQIRKMIREQGSIRNFEVDYRTKSGRVRTGLLSTEIIDIGGKKCILGTMQDITERKRSENSLKAERRRLFALLDGIPALVYVLAPDYSIRFSNKSFWKQFGKPKNKPCYEIVANRSEPCEECPTFSVFAANTPNNWEWTLADGHCFEVYNYPLADPDGSPLVLSLCIDITERKQLKQEMSRMAKMNLIGEMAAGIAHEVRNPMTTVRGFLQILGNKSYNHENRDYFKLMIEELDRANSIITEFLSLAKNKTENMKLYNLNSIIKAITPLIQADTMNSAMDLAIELGDIPDLVLNDKEIRQLILNLARNGLEAMTCGGCLSIRTLLEGKEVVLAVQDQGQQIPPEILKKLGTPFFTTKSDGTGLGLAICYSIAKRHNARIEIDSGAAGTTVYVRFNYM